MPVEMIGANIGSLAIAEAAIATEASITATSSATGNTCISTGAFGVSNPGNYRVWIFTPYLTKGTTNLDIELWDGGTSGTFLTTITGHMTASAVLGTGITFSVVVTLAAGSHNMVVTGFVDAGTGKFGANNGATGNPPNARIWVTTA